MAHTQKLNGQDQVYHVMIKREPVQLDDTTFQFEVDNTIQLTRLEVQNYDLVIQLEMVKDAPEEVKYLNGHDRFDKLAKKNSNLFDLKNRFNLDIDY
jgi:predicted sulfurtransferase